jgi:nucleotide-binding universal stress UspA family protein
VTFLFSRILLATEGTEFDVGAERVGIELAGKCGIPLLAVLPLVSNPEYQIRAPEREEKAEAEAAEKLQKLRESAAARGVQIQGTVRLGEEPFREIVDEARERDAQLIVLRRRGKRSYLANLFMGEMVHTVIGHTHCDVLTVPRAAQLWSHGIILATDGSPHSERATAVAAELAVCWGLPLTVISVAEGKEGLVENESTAAANVERALTAARAAGAEATGRVVSDSKPFRAILATETQTGADLIVIGRRGLNPVKRILVGSTSERVAGSANGAVLIIQQDVPRGARA